MGKRLMKRHAVEIPEAVWGYAVQATGGQAQPQGFIRELLFEGMMAHQRHHVIVDGVPTAQPPTSTPIVSDPGAISVIQRAAMCSAPGCGTMIEKGEEAVFRTGATGQKEILHLDHVRRQPKGTGVSRSPYVP
jgi:hypothetical protein